MVVVLKVAMHLRLQQHSPPEGNQGKVQPSFPEEGSHRQDNQAMDHGHRNKSERKRKRQRCFFCPRQGGKAENTPPFENDREESGIEVLSAVKWPCHDRTFP